MHYDPKEFKKYPEVMSKEQLYKVCHIAKRTATYLLQSGLIPNTYTGKQTRCYQIKKNDVIEFLEDREVNGFDITADISKVPAGGHQITFVVKASDGRVFDMEHLDFTSTYEGESEPQQPEQPINPGTADIAVIAIAAVACIALAGIVVAKKVK